MSDMQRERGQGEQPSPVESHAGEVPQGTARRVDSGRRRWTRTGRARVLVVDAFPLTRLGVRRFLEEAGEFEVCGEADSYESAMKKVKRRPPDLAIVSLRLRRGDGLDLIRAIAARFPRTRTLVLSMHAEDHFADRALRAGASGYMTKSEPPSALLEAVRRVLAGGLHLSPQMRERLLRRATEGDGAANGSPLAHLTDREAQVFLLIGRGLALREIASHLDLGGKTVETYRERIKTKLGLTSASAVSAAAVTWSLS